MKGKFFWFLFTGLIAVCVHIAYVLFGPGFVMDRKFQATGNKASAQFHVLSGPERAKLAAASDPSLVVAVCQYDIENQPYEITIPAWKDYWSLAMYSQKGNVFFSIFDRQVTIDKLQVKLVRQSADKPAGGPQGEGASEDLTIVEAPQTRGWIVLRALATSRAMKARRQSEVTNATRCKPVSGAKN